MANWRKAALGLAGALVLVVAAGALAIHARIDPAQLEKQAREKARAAWGRDLAMGGVSLDLFPRPTLVAEDVVIANPEWAREREMVRAKRVVARLALWPLVFGKARVTSIVLEGARANLEVRADGAKSWELPRREDGAASAAPSGGEWMRIEEVQVSNAEVAYRRASGGLDLWRLESANAEMERGLRDVRVEAKLSRNGHGLHAKGRFADLSRLGQAGAASQGDVELDWGKTRATAKGRIPLDHGMEDATFEATLQSRSLDDMLAFFGRRERHTAPLDARAQVTRSKGEVDLRGLHVALGKQRIAGDLKLEIGHAPLRFTAHLASDDLDWSQALLDAGDQKPAPPPKGEMFPVRPLPWGMLAAMQGKQGSVDLKLGRLLLPDGIELRNASARMTIDGDRLVVDPFAAQALGGTAKGALRFVGRDKAVQVELAANDVLLERWFRERHRPVHFRGGPMKVKASFRASGASMKDLAASMTGPVSIRMGRGVYDSKVAGDWEARMVNFAKDSAQEIDFECVGAALPFVSGKASGKEIVGARSRESRLLASGFVDFREEAVELKGRVRPKPNEGVGLATIADDIRIAGKIRHMQVRLDPESKPKVIAKAGAAIVTAGLSVLATAASNSAERDPDPCEAVFTKDNPPRP